MADNLPSDFHHLMKIVLETTQSKPKSLRQRLHDLDTAINLYNDGVRCKMPVIPNDAQLCIPRNRKCSTYIYHDTGALCIDCNDPSARDQDLAETDRPDIAQQALIHQLLALENMLAPEPDMKIPEECGHERKGGGISGKFQ